tara:strand:+ start:238 stop:861 length:624 start_codon:yes stop_codon:yes gene_type:complete
MHGLPELLQFARDGDQQARGELITRFYDRTAALVHRQMKQRLKPQQHALLRQLSTGDIVQEVFMEVLRGLDRWEGDREEAFVSLLATLVEHRLVDQVRRSQAARRDVRRLGDVGPTTAGVHADQRGPATLAGNEEQLAIYREVLAGFHDRDRALLTMRLEDGLEFGELADRLGWQTPDAARKAFHLVQAKLLLRLRQRGVDPGGDEL